MGIFSRKTAGPAAKPPKHAKLSAPADEVLTPQSQQAAKKEGGVLAATAAKGQAGMSYRVLRSPHVSEKAAISASHNVYVFNVPVTAEKVEIAKAVEALYGVKVEAVRTASGIGKRFSGRRHGSRNRWKKAFVCVKRGQKIDLYEGV